MSGIRGMIGVAISTTGDKHRMGFLETALLHWRRVLPLGSVLLVTVDGDSAACERVVETLRKRNGPYVPFGTALHVGSSGRAGKRLGVAANKNTGLEALMDTGAEHLFLADDDSWPISPVALDVHTAIRDSVPHSMVCWGKSRHPRIEATSPNSYATWSWPRGVLLYQTRQVVEQVGGMVEAFGIGGHEHAEYSRRIYQAGLTPAPFCSPSIYAHPHRGHAALGAAALWACQDMPQFVGNTKETTRSLGARRARITSVDGSQRDWDQINLVMEEMDGHPAFVPYRANQNGRASATIAQNSQGQGAGGEK